MRVFSHKGQAKMERFSGQWLGKLSGSQTGDVLLDIDYRKSWLEGSIYGFTDAPDAVNVFAVVQAQPSESSRAGSSGRSATS